MPNRILKESICTSEDYGALTPFQRDVFIRLIVTVDDFGRYDGRPTILKGRMFPLENTTANAINDALNRLATLGMIQRYTVAGKPYLALTSWSSHQQTRAAASKFPGPDESDACEQTDDIICNQSISDDITCNQAQSGDGKCARNRNTKTINDKRDNPPIIPPGGWPGIEEGPLLDALRGFEEMRKHTKHVMTDRAKTLLLNRLRKLSDREDEWIAMLDEATLNAWRSVFLPNKNKKPKPERMDDLDEFF